MGINRLPSLSILVSTYNKPEFLEICLESLLRQSHKDFEIIVTDDGSTETTEQLIRRFQDKSPVSIRHVWQEDRGFRLARIRNLGMTKAEGDYVVFTDQDCIADPDLIKDHLEKAERGQVLQGNRRLISKGETEKFLNLPLDKLFGLDLKNISRRHHLEYYCVHKVFRHVGALVDCNISGFKADFLSVGPYDERFQNWGGQDFDLGFRMQRRGFRLAFNKDKSYVYHLYHPGRRNLLNAEYRRLYWRILKHYLGLGRASSSP